MIYRGHHINEFAGYLQPYNVAVWRGTSVVSHWFGTKDGAKEFIDNEVGQLRVVFVGWNTPDDLEARIDHAMPLLDGAFRRIEYDHDTVHLVRADQVQEARRIIDELNQQLDTTMTLDVEDYNP